MLYFIPWVVLIVVAVLAVPIAAVMEKKKHQAEFGEDAPDPSFDDDDEGLEPLEAGDGALLEEGAVSEEPQDGDDPFGTGAPDDFSAFEEEFK